MNNFIVLCLLVSLPMLLIQESEKKNSQISILPSTRVFVRPAAVINEQIPYFQDPPPVLSIPVPIANFDEPVDSILLDAIYNPRERMQVLNIENTVFSFARSRYS